MTYDGSDRTATNSRWTGLGTVCCTSSWVATDVWNTCNARRASGRRRLHRPFKLYIAPLFRRSVFVSARADVVDGPSDRTTVRTMPTRCFRSVDTGGTLESHGYEQCQLQITEAVRQQTLSAVAPLDYARRPTLQR